MRRFRTALTLLLAAALCLAAFAALAESDYTYFPESERYVGSWASDDCTLLIVHMYDDYNLFNCIVTRLDGGNKGTRWIYDACAYDDVGRALSSFELGMCFDITVDDAGELLSSEQIYDDGAASFALDGDGKLVWTDFKQTPGEDEVVFEKVIDPEPAFSADELAGGYVDVICGVEQGTAGASLKQALAAAEICRFAAGHDLSAADDDNVTGCVLVALARLDEAQLAAFGDSFDALAALADSCFADWDANRGLFDDAGVAGDMELLAMDPEARYNWIRLRDATLAALVEPDGE